MPFTWNRRDKTIEKFFGVIVAGIFGLVIIGVAIGLIALLYVVGATIVATFATI